MNDRTKTIAELKELEAKATPTGWEVHPGITPLDNHIYGTIKGSRGMSGKIASHMFPSDADLIVAMRNALPELLEMYDKCKTRIDAAYQSSMNEAHEMRRQRDAALAHAEKGEREALEKASQFLQDAGYEDASKALDCEFEL